MRTTVDIPAAVSVTFSRRVRLNPVSVPLPAPLEARVAAWRDMAGISAASTLETVGFREEDGRRELHDAAIGIAWFGQGLGAAQSLLYLHRGHQVVTHTPILQRLLGLLGHRGAVHSLRVEDRKALADAMRLARLLAVRFGSVAILSDTTERLARSMPGGRESWARLLLLSAVGEWVDDGNDGLAGAGTRHLLRPVSREN